MNRGETAVFTVETTGVNLAYQWQYKAVGSDTWKNSGMTRNKTPELTVSVTLERSGQQYRCVVSNDAGSVESEAATLSLLMQ
jgi:hypothetical protein